MMMMMMNPCKSLRDPLSARNKLVQYITIHSLVRNCMFPCIKSVDSYTEQCNGIRYTLVITTGGLQMERSIKR